MSEAARSPRFLDKFENLFQPIITDAPLAGSSGEGLLNSHHPHRPQHRGGRSLSRGRIRAAREREKEIEIEIGGGGGGAETGLFESSGGGFFGGGGRNRGGGGRRNNEHLDHIAEAFAFKGGEVFFCSLLGSVLGGLLAWGLGLFLLLSGGLWLFCCLVRCLCRVVHFVCRLCALFLEEFLPLWLVQIIRVAVKVGKAIDVVVHDIEADLLHAIVKIALRLLETLCYWLEARLENFVSYGDNIFERRFVKLKERFGGHRDGRRHWF